MVGHPEGADDIEHLSAVGTGEDAVLVLDDRDVVGVQGVGRRVGPAGGAADPLVADHSRDLVGVDDPHHADMVARGLQGLHQSLAEGGQPALGGRIGAEYSVRHRHGISAITIVLQG